MIGTRTMITHAPSRELRDRDDDASTTSDRNAPMPLMNRPQRQPGSFSRMWCLAMPACDSVNDVNTPIA